MGKVYKNQTYLTITLETKQDLADADTVLIKYRKPSGTTGSFDAAIENSANGTIFHKFEDGQLDEAGQWVFWAYIEFDNGDCAAGEPAFLIVYEEGC